MTKQTQSTIKHGKQTQGNRHTSKKQSQLSIPTTTSDLLSLERAVGNGDMNYHVSRLGDPNLPIVQRQTIARQIGGIAGNQYLQRVMSRVGNGSAAAKDDVGKLDLRDGDIQSAMQLDRDEIQRQPDVIQRNPAALAFAGLSAEAWTLAGTVAGIVTGVGGAAAGTYSAVSRGENAFGSLVFPQNLVSNSDKGKLQQIAQFRIINEYVRRYLARPAATSTPAPAAGGTAGPTGTPTAATIDQEVLTAVKNSVQTELQTALERVTNTTSAEFMWGEDNTQGNSLTIGGAGDAESVGVTGRLQYRNLEISVLNETLTLSAEAKSALGSITGEGTALSVHKFIGGSVGGEATWSAWDNLSVNVEGGAAQQSYTENGAVKLIVRTVWYWDRWGPNSQTKMQNEITVGDDGAITISEAREGTP